MMTPDEYREALKRHGLTQIRFAQLLGAKPRTGQYWATVAVPPAVATIVELLDRRPALLPVIEQIAAEREGRRDPSPHDSD